MKRRKDPTRDTLQAFCNDIQRIAKELAAPAPLLELMSGHSLDSLRESCYPYNSFFKDDPEGLQKLSDTIDEGDKAKDIIYLLAVCHMAQTVLSFMNEWYIEKSFWERSLAAERGVSSKEEQERRGELKRLLKKRLKKFKDSLSTFRDEVLTPCAEDKEYRAAERISHEKMTRYYSWLLRP